jgi:maltose alpha-D-glucosyltransferase/alpha-amylase
MVARPQWRLPRADPAMLYLPPNIGSGIYGFEAVNVEAQSRSPHHYSELDQAPDRGAVSRRAFGRGGHSTFQPPQGHRLLREDGKTRQSLCIANLSRTARAVALDLAEFAAGVIQVLGRSVSADRRPALSADLQPPDFSGSVAAAGK